MKRANHQDWWLLVTLTMVSLWVVLIAWWAYLDSRPLFQVEVTGAHEGYARLVVKDPETGWREEAPVWFPAYPLEEGKGIVSFRIQPGHYQGFRLALEQGQPVGETFAFYGKMEAELPPFVSWNSVDGKSVLAEWSKEGGQLPDQRPRNVSTWQWEREQPFLVERISPKDWLPGVLVKAVLGLVVMAGLSAGFYLMFCTEKCYANRCWNHIHSCWARFQSRQTLGVILILIFSGLLLWKGTSWFNQHFGEEMFLRLEMSSSEESTAQVFFRNKEWFDEQKSALSPVIGSDLRQTFFFPLGRERIRSIRLDPLMRDGIVTLYSAQVVSSRGKVIHHIPFDTLDFDEEEDSHQIAEHSFDPQTGQLRLVTVSGASDPNLLLLEPGTLTLKYSEAIDTVVLGILWAIYGVFLVRVLTGFLLPQPVLNKRGWQYLQSRSVRYLLISAAGTMVLILPTVYFLEFFEEEASYLEMSATSNGEVRGAWHFHSRQDNFLHRDFPFSLDPNERRSFNIALPRNNVHRYQLEILGGEQDTVLEIDTLKASIPGQKQSFDLLVEQPGFRWVNPPVERGDGGGWRVDIPAGQDVWFFLEVDAQILEHQPVWFKASVLSLLIFACFAYLWQGRKPDLQAESPYAHSRRAAHRFLWLMLGFGSIFIFVTPPFQSPDEPRWLDRSWHLSEGHWFPEVRDDLAGGEVPTSLRTVYHKVSYDIAFNPHHRTSVERWKEANEVALEEDEVFFARMGDNTHSLLPYLPQSLGFRIGKIFGFTPLEMTYAARVVNLMLASLIVFLAIRIFPVIPWTVLVLFLSPIMVFLYGSANHDPMTNSLTLLFIAYVFLLRDRGRILGWKHCMLLIGLITLVITSKFIYVMLAGLLLILPRELFYSARDRWMKIGVCWTIMIVITLSWLGMLSNYPPFDYDRPEVDQAVNVAILKQNPQTVGKWILNTYPYDVFMWKEQFVGILGWLDTPLPRVIHLVWWMALGGAFLADVGGAGWRPGVLTRGWLLVLLGLITSTIILLFYLVYTQPGLERIQGVQGRYLLPLLPIVATVLAFRSNALSEWVPWLRRFAVCGISLALFMTLVLLRYRYWDFIF